MRGEILEVNASGGGQISGDDGVRYAFTSADMAGGPAPTFGGRVDFIVDAAGRASQIVVLDAQPAFAGTPAYPTTGLHPATPRLTPWQHFKRCCTSAYFQGEGRANMTEYWSFVLIEIGLYLLAFVPIMLLLMVAGAMAGGGEPPAGVIMLVGFMAMLVGLSALYFFIPGITAMIRRLHDIGQSGFWLFLALVPFGSIALLVMTLMPSQPGPNQYGMPSE